MESSGPRVKSPVGRSKWVHIAIPTSAFPYNELGGVYIAGISGPTGRNRGLTQWRISRVCLKGATSFLLAGLKVPKRLIITSVL